MHRKNELMIQSHISDVSFVAKYMYISSHIYIHTVKSLATPNFFGDTVLDVAERNMWVWKSSILNFMLILLLLWTLRAKNDLVNQVFG